MAVTSVAPFGAGQVYEFLRLFPNFSTLERRGAMNGDLTNIADEIVAVWAQLDSPMTIEDLTVTNKFRVDVWEDLRVPVQTASVGPVGAPTLGQVFDNGAGSTGVFSYQFATAPPQEEQLYFTVQLPHGWLQGSDIKAHVHWFGQTNGGAGEKVSWGLEYNWANIASVFGNTSLIYGDTVMSAEDIVADKHYVTAIGTIDATAKTLSSMLMCRIFRDAAGVGGTDDYPNDAVLLEIDFHYQKNSVGSEAEFSKTP